MASTTFSTTCPPYNTLLQVIRHLKDASLQPIIVFSFSRRDCEQYSIAVGSPERGQLCFTTAEEQEAIEEVGGGGRSRASGIAPVQSA